MPQRCVSFVVSVIYRTYREVVSNIENIRQSDGQTTDGYVSGDVKLDLMKGTRYTLYSDLIIVGLDQLICRLHVQSRNRVSTTCT